MTYTFHLRDANGRRQAGGGRRLRLAFQRLFVSSGFSQIYDIIENGAAVREGTKTPEELGVSAPDDHTLVIKLNGPAPSSSASPPRRSPRRRAPTSSRRRRRCLRCRRRHLRHQRPVPARQLGARERDRAEEEDPDYWNADAIKLDEVRILVLPDTGTQRNMFDNGGSTSTASLPCR